MCWRFFLGSPPHWHAIDHGIGAVLAYIFGRPKDEVFVGQALLEPFGIARSYTNHWLRRET